ncbi:MAG TPA: ABC transporter permease [Sulfolobales archaeon]|nr:ABC transporter permease [Sulfolobales archaeon]
MPGARSFIVRRVALYVALFFVVVIVTFILVHITPGDPTYVLAGEISDESFIKAVREKFGLDKPLYEQLVIYLLNVVKGDLGYSYLRSEPVASLVMSRIPATVVLVITAMLAASILGILLGILAAIRRGLADIFISMISLVGVSVPYFWLGQMMLLAFSVNLGLFPTGGMVSVRGSYEGIYYYLDVLHHLFLPATTLAIFNMAYVTKMTRGALINELAQDYILTARAIGMSEKNIVLRYALRGALIPVTTFIGFNTGVLLISAIVTETVFSWPGMGSLLYSSLKLRDYPVMLGVFIYGSLIIIVISFVIDIIYMILDPRVRRGAAG